MRSTPPTGTPMVTSPEPDTPTPPEGVDLSAVIAAEDVGTASPAVPGVGKQPETGNDPGERPKLEYRGRTKPQRPAPDWFRRGSGE